VHFSTKSQDHYSIKNKSTKNKNLWNNRKKITTQDDLQQLNDFEVKSLSGDYLRFREHQFRLCLSNPHQFDFQSRDASILKDCSHFTTHHKL
jgi:hypothetical protein